LASAANRGHVERFDRFELVDIARRRVGLLPYVMRLKCCRGQRVGRGRPSEGALVMHEIGRYYVRMASTRVTVTLDPAALAAARQAAKGSGESLSEWLSRAAWRRAIEDAAAFSAEQDRRRPEWQAWDEARAEVVLGGASG
jgi:hypothetical protein